jgi:hypothetical protein
MVPQETQLKEFLVEQKLFEDSRVQNLLARLQ